MSPRTEGASEQLAPSRYRWRIGSERLWPPSFRSAVGPSGSSAPTLQREPRNSPAVSSRKDDMTVAPRFSAEFYPHFTGGWTAGKQVRTSGPADVLWPGACRRGSEASRARHSWLQSNPYRDVGKSERFSVGSGHAPSPSPGGTAETPLPDAPRKRNKAREHLVALGQRTASRALFVSRWD
jgi:hypothetical protein